MSDDQTLAKISQNALVVSFKNAKSPTVWRAKLDTLDEMSFTVQTAGKGKYTLVATKDQKDEVIAEFTTKTAGEQALNAMTDVLFNLDGHQPEITAAVKANTHSPHAPALPMSDRSFVGWRSLYWVSFVVLFLVLFAMFSKGVQNIPLGGGKTPATATNIIPSTPNEQTMGGRIEDMPDPQLGRSIPAEDFFKDR